MKPRSYCFGRLFLPAAAFISFAGSAHAVDQTWTGGTNGSWATGSNWSGSAVPGAASGVASGDTATFSSNVNTAVTVDAYRNIKNIIFDSGAGSFTLSGGQLVLTNGGSIMVKGGVTNTETIDTNILLSTTASSTYSFINDSNTAGAKLNFGGTISGQAVQTLTLGGSNGGTISGVIGNGTGTVSLTKSGLGTWTINSSTASSYTGGTKINGGQLKLDFSNLAGVSNLVASQALTMGGGTLSIQGKSATANTQAVTTLSNTSGTSSKILLTPGASGGTVGLTVSNALAAPVLGTLQLSSTGTTTLSANLSSTFLLSGAVTFGADNFAATSAAGVVSAAAMTPVTTAWTTSAINDVTGNVSSTGASISPSAIRFADATGRTANITTGTMTSPTILVASTAGTSSLTGGAAAFLRSFSNGANRDFNVIQNSANDFTIGVNLSNPGSSGSERLVKSGPGRLILSNAGNSYTLGTYINEGIVSVSANGNLGGVAGGVILNGGTLQSTAAVALDNGATFRGVTVNSNGGSLDALASGNTLTVGGVVTGAGLLSINSGVGAAGTVILSAGNNNSGGTNVKAGTLQINGINALGGANYGGLTLNGGTLKYATAFSGNGSGDLTSVGTAGITVASGGGTIDTNGNSVSYAGSIGNGGSGSLTKAGSGTLILSAASTYTGGTTINGGTLTAGNASSLGTGALAIGSGGTLSTGGFNLGVGAITLSGSANILLSGTASQITSSGAISISGAGNVLTLGGGAASAGNTYTLILGNSLSASGISLAGTAVGGSTVALGSTSTVGRTTYAFNATSTALQLAVTGGAFNLTWNGGDANWNTTDANWQKDGVGSNIAFFAGDNITISTSNSIAVDAGGVTAGTLAVTNVSGTTTLTGGAISAASLSKSGAGILQVSNSITGASLTVSGGELAMGTQNQSFANVSLTGGSITGSTAVLTGTGSAFDMQAGSVSAILNGSLGLTKTTAGTVTLSGVNTYTGATSVNSGTLAVSGSGTLGNGAALNLGGGTVALGGSSQTVGAVNITAAATSGNTIENGSLTGTSYTASNASDNAIVTANLLANGAAGLNKSGGGTLTLSGANTYTGATLVKNGSLVLDGGANRLLNTGSAVIGDVATTGKLILGGTTAANQAFTGLTATGLGGSVVGGNAANSTLTLDIVSANTFGGTLGGAGTNENNLALIKSGMGTLTLSGANTYTGGTALNVGTLVLNNGTAAGSGTITAANGTSISLTTSSGVGNAVTISGTDASVTLLSNQASAGYGSNITGSADQTVRISGNPVNFNNTTRQFTNFLGTVNVLSGSTLSDRSSTTTWVNGGDSTLFNIDGSVTSRNAGTWALGGLTGAGTLSMGTAGSNNLWLNYTIGARNDTNDTFSGVFQDGDTATGKRVSLTKVGTGIQTLTGANTFTGTTTIDNGTLYANAANGANGRSLSFTSGITVNSGGTLQSSANALFGWDGTQERTITVNSGGTLAADGGLTSDVGVGTVILNGGTMTTVAGGATDYGSFRFDDATDKLQVTNNSTISAVNVKFGNASAALEVASGKTANFTGTITDASAGGISYLTKTGAGTLILAGTNNYTGATTVSGGKLVVNGSITSNAAVASGTTIGGSGTITGSLSLSAESSEGAGNGGKLAAGNSPGVLTVTGTTTFNTGSIFSWDLDTTQTDPETNRSVAYDGVNTGAVAGSNAIFQVVLAGAQDFSSTFWEQDRTWSDIFKTADGGSILSDWASAFSSITYSNGLSTLDTPAVYGSFTLSGSSLHWDSSFSAVPEPTSALAGLLIGAGLLRRRRSA